MKKYLKHFYSFITIAVFIMLAIGSATPKPLTLEENVIPHDFFGYRNVLLIEKHSNDYNKYANKYFTDNYSGAFVLASLSEINRDYSDTIKYRFALIRRTTFEMKHQPFGKKPHENEYEKEQTTKYCILDRVTGEISCTDPSPLYGKMLLSLSKALESARLRDGPPKPPTRVR